MTIIKSRRIVVVVGTLTHTSTRAIDDRESTNSCSSSSSIRIMCLAHAVLCSVVLLWDPECIVVLTQHGTCVQHTRARILHAPYALVCTALGLRRRSAWPARPGRGGWAWRFLFRALAQRRVTAARSTDADFTIQTCVCAAEHCEGRKKNTHSQRETTKNRIAPAGAQTHADVVVSSMRRTGWPTCRSFSSVRSNVSGLSLACVRAHTFLVYNCIELGGHRALTLFDKCTDARMNSANKLLL